MAGRPSSQDVHADAMLAWRLQQEEKEAWHRQPKFTCPICADDHLVDGSITLSCDHRYCLTCLQRYFKDKVREHRLDQLKCPCCGLPLTDLEGALVLEDCLSPTTRDNFLEQKATEIPNVKHCRHRGCSEAVWVEPGDEVRALKCPQGHRFCADCDNGPHLGLTCAAKKEEMGHQDDWQALQTARAGGWAPCPRQGCQYGGGYKDESDCDHVTCRCGHEYCFLCGANRKTIMCHDNLWHKPSCKYHPGEGVPETRFCRDCPTCLEQGTPCKPPADDGWPLNMGRPLNPPTDDRLRPALPTFLRHGSPHPRGLRSSERDRVRSLSPSSSPALFLEPLLLPQFMEQALNRAR